MPSTFSKLRKILCKVLFFSHLQFKNGLLDSWTFVKVNKVKKLDWPRRSSLRKGGVSTYSRHLCWVKATVKFSVFHGFPFDSTRTNQGPMERTHGRMDVQNENNAAPPCGGNVQNGRLITGLINTYPLFSFFSDPDTHLCI